MRWVEEGRIQAPPLQRFSFDKAADAHRSLESGETVGKLILKFSKSS
jgi:NADPH:quinone reductase-like Zn-dependent oxidoreductase